MLKDKRGYGAYGNESEKDLDGSRFVDRTMGLSPPRSTTMMLQSPDNSKINI